MAMRDSFHWELARTTLIFTVAAAGVALVIDRPPEAYLIAWISGLAVYTAIRYYTTQPETGGPT